MSEIDWQPGDLALFVKRGVILCAKGRHTGVLAEGPMVREVRAITVSVLRTGKACGCVRLLFTDGTMGVSQRFIKVTPPEVDPLAEALLAWTGDTDADGLADLRAELAKRGLVITQADAGWAK